MFECRMERKKNVLGENRKMGGGDGNRRFQSVKCRVPQGWDTMRGGRCINILSIRVMNML